MLKLPCKHSIFIIHTNGAIECNICGKIYIKPKLIPIYKGEQYTNIVEVIDEKEGLVK